MSLKITIITPSYNQGGYIEQTIRSVLAQNYENVEHIVIDGGSTDQTVDVLKKYPHVIWISEKDRGQTDALNKGLKIATGDIIGWINSDDFYEKNIFKSVVECFQNPETMWVVGNLTYFFEKSGKLITNKSPVVTFDHLIKSPDIVRQQPTFFRKDLLKRVGGWNPDFFMAMDFDLWIRMAKIFPPKIINEQWAVYRNHAFQKTSHENILRQVREITSILRRESVSTKNIVMINIKKRWFWIKGYIKDFLIDCGMISSQYRNESIRKKF
ncbi:hypothetical protein BuS5_01224 [Desulfosarcina sp. BuS5]|uniref:glycosyltransferase family 2 protein n=1 Tax=Desulfosarcina sp. BuS5 TaxID=933262 RepID=UPI00055950F6|nr:glycosyltransferase family 2 protein [Desulfosarcina sp. BuS5]WDN88256.1 hypothetical protein BuS5_01224 [Desulfosarcina sp. BuS5]